MATDLGLLLTEFVTVVATIFIAELTDKDALLLLALATKMKPWAAFAAGATAFTITSAIIVCIDFGKIWASARKARAMPSFFSRWE